MIRRLLGLLLESRSILRVSFVPVPERPFEAEFWASLGGCPESDTPIFDALRGAR